MPRNLMPLAVLTGLAAIFAAPAANAGAADYAFEPVKTVVKNGTGSQLQIRLVHKSTGKPVIGAILFRTRLDMSPDGMAAMTAQHAPLPETEPGVYGFSASLTMAGGWAFKVMARIQGEPDTVTGTVVFTAQD